MPRDHQLEAGGSRVQGFSQLYHKFETPWATWDPDSEKGKKSKVSSHWLLQILSQWVMWAQAFTYAFAVVLGKQHLKVHVTVQNPQEVFQVTFPAQVKGSTYKGFADTHLPSP